MASTLTRRPLPALVSLLALLLLTGLVWLRVLHRGGSSSDHKATPCPTPTARTVGTLPAPATITLSVLNSTNRSGIAAKARTALLNDGFKVPADAANDTKFKNKIPGTAQIRFGPTGKQAATLVRYYFPGAVLVTTPSKSATVVVSLGAKYRTISSPKAVQAALSGDRLAVAGATSSAGPSGSASC